MQSISVQSFRSRKRLIASSSQYAVACGLACALLAPTVATATETEPSAPALEEVVVTARQRSENLQDTPFSIVAIGEEKLQAQNIVSTLDLDNRVPGLEIRPDNTRLTPFVGIRGVGDIARNPGIDARVGLYLDGIPLGRSGVTSYPIFDIESIEVLRGPQGTLFGNNSMTGVIAIQSQKPSFEETSRMTIGAGSRNLFSGSGFLNTPLSDQLALRVTLAGKSQQGYYSNTLDGGSLGGGNFYAGRAQLRYRPSDSTTVDFSIDGVSAHDNLLLVVGRQVGGPGVALGLSKFQAALNVSPVRDRELFGAGLTIVQKLPRDFELTAITSYRTSDDKLRYDTDGLPADQLYIDLRNKDRAFSQEVRIASPQNELYDFVLGGFFYNQHPSNAYISHYGVAFPTVAARGTTVVSNGSVTANQFALFAHGSLRPFEWLTLDGGLRWQQTKKDARKRQVANAAAGYPAVSLDRSLKDDSVNPLVSVTVKPVEGVNVYALYSTGDRAGGFNVDLLRSPIGFQFDAESVRNYEVGIKASLFDNRLRVNVAAYEESFKDFQVSQTIVPPAVGGNAPATVVAITNAAKAVSRGIEADFDFAATRELTLAGGLGFNEAHFQSFPNGGGLGVNYTGNRLPEAPRFQGSFSATYRRQLTQDYDGVASLNYVYRSHVYSSPANNNPPITDNRFLQGGFGTVGGRVAVINDSKNIELAVYARNIFDEDHVDGAAISSLGAVFQTLSEPRTVGIELTLRR